MCVLILLQYVGAELLNGIADVTKGAVVSFTAQGAKPAPIM